MSSLNGFESYTDKGKEKKQIVEEYRQTSKFEIKFSTGFKDFGFINTLCSVLEKDLEKKDLEDVFRNVQAEMSQISFRVPKDNKAEITVQTPERISSLRKNVVFRKQDTRNTGQILLQEDFSIDERFVKKRDGWNKWRSLMREKK